MVLRSALLLTVGAGGTLHAGVLSHAVCAGRGCDWRGLQQDCRVLAHTGLRRGALRVFTPNARNGRKAGFMEESGEMRSAVDELSLAVGLEFEGVAGQGLVDLDVEVVAGA